MRPKQRPSANDKCLSTIESKEKSSPINHAVMKVKKNKQKKQDNVRKKCIFKKSTMISETRGYKTLRLSLSQVKVAWFVGWMRRFTPLQCQIGIRFLFLELFLMLTSPSEPVSCSLGPTYHVQEKWLMNSVRENQLWELMQQPGACR